MYLPMVHNTYDEDIARLEEVKNSIHAMRIFMAHNGWHSEIRVSRMGMNSSPINEAILQIWFSRWDWKGRPCDKITFFTGAKVDINDFDRSLDRSKTAIYRAAEACFRSQRDYVDKVPHMSMGADENGLLNLCVNDISTKYVFGKDPIRAVYPTENLQDVYSYVSDFNDNSYFRSIFPMVGNLFTYNDRLTTFGFNDHWKYQDRDWGLQYSVIPHKSGDVKISYSREKINTYELGEKSICEEITSKYESVIQSLRDYAVGGHKHGETSNALPPEYMTIREYAIKQKISVFNYMCNHLVRLIEDGLDFDEYEAEYILETWKELKKNMPELNEIFPDSDNLEWLKEYVEHIVKEKSEQSDNSLRF